MCHFISTASDKRVGPPYFFLNDCPKGVHCENSHCMEEILYHPNCHKSNECILLCTCGQEAASWATFAPTCTLLTQQGRSRNSPRADLMVHSTRLTCLPRRKNGQPNAGAKAALSPSMGSPVIYASPAPFSSFERQLAMPGLQSLFCSHTTIGLGSLEREDTGLWNPRKPTSSELVTTSNHYIDSNGFQVSG
jgi:hypothetical protein